MSKKFVSIFFIIAGLYDGLLGLTFLLFPARAFEYYQTTPPNHFGYVQFPALILIIFGIMFFAVAKDPLKNRNLIPYGILLKLSYCSIVFYYWMFGIMANMFKPFAVFDFIFLVFFVVIYYTLKKK